MTSPCPRSHPTFLIVPADQQSALTIRAKALAFADPRSRELLEHLDKRAPQPHPVVLLANGELVVSCWHVGYTSAAAGPGCSAA